MTWNFYDPKTGLLHGRRFHGSARNVELNTPEGFVAIEGELDRLSQRIDLESGEVVDYQPPQPSPDHEWREKAFNDRPRWVKKPDVLEREAKDRAARAGLDAIDARTIRKLREKSADPELVALEAEAAALRRDVMRTPSEQEKSERFPL